MSFARIVYYSAVIGGWAAFLGWGLAELLVFSDDGGTGQVVIITALVGACIGAGLNVVAGLSNPQWKRILLRTLIGLGLGAAGGALGGLLGNLLFEIGVPRAFGFMVLGLCVGVADGIFDLSPRKVLNGAIGGAAGGLVGGFLLDLLLNAQAGMSGRATAFVVLGACIGLLIGFVQVILKQAWITVLDGYGPGRQLILSGPSIVLGRADYLPLPFLGPANANLAAEHARLVRQVNGTYALEPIDVRQGTAVNHKPVNVACLLADGDVIKIGTNFVRFNERKKHRDDEAAPAGAIGRQSIRTPPPPPGRAAPAPPRPASAPPSGPLPPKVSPPAAGPAANAPPAARPNIAPPAAPRPVVPTTPPPAAGGKKVLRPVPPPPTPPAGSGGGSPGGGRGPGGPGIPMPPPPKKK